MKNSKSEPKSVDFSKGVRGKYYEAAMAAQTVVVLDADLRDTFPDSESVNAALRSLKQIAQQATVTKSKAA